jgi:hypothetical protein
MAIPLEPCRSCGTPVRWVVTVGAAAMPLDPDMCPDGNYVFTGEDETGNVRALTKAEIAGPADRPRYKSHFASCPQSRTWRKGAVQGARARTLQKTLGGVIRPVVRR